MGEEGQVMIGDVYEEEYDTVRIDLFAWITEAYVNIFDSY